MSNGLAEPSASTQNDSDFHDRAFTVAASRAVTAVDLRVRAGNMDGFGTSEIGNHRGDLALTVAQNVDGPPY